MNGRIASAEEFRQVRELNAPSIFGAPVQVLVLSVKDRN